jgi:hypothetical protein
MQKRQPDNQTPLSAEMESVQLLHDLHFLQVWMQESSIHAPSKPLPICLQPTRLSQAPATAKAQIHSTKHAIMLLHHADDNVS